MCHLFVLSYYIEMFGYTCKDLARSQDEPAFSFFSDNEFIKFFKVAPIPLPDVCESADERPLGPSGWASKHF
jgi:hypothetical protein